MLLGSDPHLFQRDQVVTASVERCGRRVGPDRADRGAARWSFRSGPTPTRVCRVDVHHARSPKRPGRKHDTRELGARFLRFDYRR